MAVRVTGRLICADDTQGDVVRAMLPDHIRLSRAEPGCLAFDVRPTDDPLIWALDETFLDAAAFAAHQARTKASPWWTATQQIARDFQIDDTA